jgi:hypothetical protein
MPRVTLYVPDELKARMDGAGEAMNWSAVAQRAFREAISTHHVRKDDSDMENVIERLRASKQRFEARQLESGKEIGRKWAKMEAEYHELAALAEFDVDIYPDNTKIDPELLANVIDPDGENPREWEEFWEDHYGVDTPSDAFLRGFIEGATEVFKEIADQL